MSLGPGNSHIDPFVRVNELIVGLVASPDAGKNDNVPLCPLECVDSRDLQMIGESVQFFVRATPNIKRNSTFLNFVILAQGMMLK